MCGIVGAAARRDVVATLIDGLKALEYRGYDSAGIALVTDQGLERLRTQGKVRELEQLHAREPITGFTGIAHTRWATHGVPNTINAHPIASRDQVALVHNGIIENHAELREELKAQGYRFDSDTDTEVIAHLVQQALSRGCDLLHAVIAATQRLHGAYAIAVVNRDQPGHVVGARRGSPLLIGVGENENFLGSDVQALIRVTNRFVYLEENDIAEITRDGFAVYNGKGERVERPIKKSELSADAVERGEYRHYMLKEIFEQPRAVADTLEGRITGERILPNIFGVDADALLAKVEHVQIIACGTSYHAGLLARYWLEAIAGIPCSVEVASEYRYRRTIVSPGSLFLAISQSGETADTLAALREAKQRGYLGSLAICNVPESSLVRESDLTLMTRAGPEIGVASTKAFTTQLTALALLVLELARLNGLPTEKYTKYVSELATLPRVLRRSADAGTADRQARRTVRHQAPCTVSRPRCALSSRA